MTSTKNRQDEDGSDKKNADPPRVLHPTRSSSALPFSVLVTLFYRVAVLYAATRIVLNLKRQTTGSWNDDDRKLSDEEPVRRRLSFLSLFSLPSFQRGLGLGTPTAGWVGH